jgi:transcriptional regulator with GAF, ATPase, and Fis domain
MATTACEQVFRALARLEADFDPPEVDSVVRGLMGFLGRALHPACASVLLCAPDAIQCDAWRVVDGGEMVQGAPVALADICAAVPAQNGAIGPVDRSEAGRRFGPLLSGMPENVRSVLMVPLKSGIAVIGAVCVGAAAVGGFPAEGRALLEAAATQTAGALKTVRRRVRDLERLAACEIERSALSRRDDPGAAGAPAGRPEPSWGAFVGRSVPLRRVVARIERVAPTDAGVLILGESGTGKELAADEIHRRSLRRDRQLVKVNCATIPRELYESEFFGHVRGAFTGAINDRVGRFEAADGGTLFLDEVGEIPLALQGKLLRVLQNGEIERVREGRTRRVDVRIIAATNKRLPDEIAAGRFRADLYYRLNVFPVELPPLRERREDLAALAPYVAAVAAARLKRPAPRLTDDDLRRLQGYDWPGNVRELQNVIERALILSADGPLVLELPQPTRDDTARPAAAVPLNPGENAVMSEAEILDLQRRNLTAALVQCRWIIYGESGAARLMGIKPTTLIERMRRMGIRRPGPQPGDLLK